MCKSYIYWCASLTGHPDMFRLSSDIIDKIQDSQGLTGSSLLITSCQSFCRGESIRKVVWRKSFALHPTVLRQLGLTQGKRMTKTNRHLTHVLSETVVVVVDVLARISRAPQSAIVVQVPQCQRAFVPCHQDSNQEPNFPVDNNMESNRLPGHALRSVLEKTTRENTFSLVHSPDRSRHICCVEAFFPHRHVICCIGVENDFSIKVTATLKKLQVDHGVWTVDNQYIQFVTNNAPWLVLFPDIIRDIIWSSARCSDDMSYWISRGDQNSGVVSSLFTSPGVRSGDMLVGTHEGTEYEETILSIFLQLIASMVSGHDVEEGGLPDVVCLNIMPPYHVEYPVWTQWKPVISHWSGEVIRPVSGKEVRFFTSNCMINRKTQSMKGIFRYWIKM